MYMYMLVKRSAVKTQEETETLNGLMFATIIFFVRVFIRDFVDRRTMQDAKENFENCCGRETNKIEGKGASYVSYSYDSMRFLINP